MCKVSEHRGFFTRDLCKKKKKKICVRHSLLDEQGEKLL